MLYLIIQNRKYFTISFYNYEFVSSQDNHYELCILSTNLNIVSIRIGSLKSVSSLSEIVCAIRNRFSSGSIHVLNILSPIAAWANLFGRICNGTSLF